LGVQGIEIKMIKMCVFKEQQELDLLDYLCLRDFVKIAIRLGFYKKNGFFYYSNN
jgi:hypothetical protein